MGKPGQTNSTSNYGRTVLQEHRNHRHRNFKFEKKKTHMSKDVIHIVMKSWENCHSKQQKQLSYGRLERDW